MKLREEPDLEIMSALEKLERAERPDDLLASLAIVERERDRRSIAMLTLFSICIVAGIASIAVAMHFFGAVGQIPAMVALSTVAGLIWNNTHVRHWRRLSDAAGKWQHRAPMMRNGQ